MSDSGSAQSPNRTVRRRNVGKGNESKGRASGSHAGMMRMYTEDTPGLRVDPVVVLVFSLVFIASVFALHIYGKFTRGS